MLNQQPLFTNLVQLRSTPIFSLASLSRVDYTSLEKIEENPYILCKTYSGVTTKLIPTFVRA